MEFFERDSRFLERRSYPSCVEFVFDCGFIRVIKHISSPCEVTHECSDSSSATWLEQKANLLEVSLYNQYIRDRNAQTLLQDIYLTRVVEGLAQREKQGITNADVPDCYVSVFGDLANRYYAVASMEEFDEWMEDFTVFSYKLVLSKLDLFRGGWRNECLMRVLPIGHFSSEIAWEYVRSHDVLENGNFKNRNDLVMDFFFGLLRAGNLDAFRLLKMLVMKEGISPSRDVCFWFKFGFLRHYSGGRMYHQYVENEDIQIGLQWEQLCYRIARLLYGDIIEQPKLKNGKLPDILPCSSAVVWDRERVKYAPKFIECKKSELSYSSESVKKYFPFCDELEIWVLETPAHEPEPDSRFKRVYGIQLANKVRPADPSLAEKILEMEKGAGSFARDARFLDRYSQLDSEIVNEILELHSFFEPHYNLLNVR